VDQKHELEDIFSAFHDEETSTLEDAFHTVLSFYHGSISRRALLELMPNPAEPMNAEQMEAVCHQLGLQMERVKKPEEIEAHMLPGILIGSDGVFVISQVHDGKLELQRPGEKSSLFVPAKELEAVEIFTFFQPENALRQISGGAKPKPYGWFWDKLRGQWPLMAQIGAITVFINIFVLAVPLFALNVYDRVIPNHAIASLLVLGIGVGVILIFDLIFKEVRVYLLESAGRKIGNALEEELMGRLLGVAGGADQMLSGAKANLFKELQQVREFFASRTLGALLDFPFFVVMIGVIWLISPALAWVPIIGAALIVLLSFLLGKPMADLARKRFDDNQMRHNYLYESINGREAIKLHNATPARLFGWRRIVHYYTRMGLQLKILSALAQNSSHLLLQLVTVGVIVVGVFEVHDQALTLGGLIAATILAGRAMVPVVALSSIASQLKEMQDSLKAIDAFWQLPQERERTLHLGIGTIKGGIELERVSFSYPEAKEPTFSELSLTLKPGEKVGIIGPTGAGKSTLMRLLSLLDRPQKGSIYIDGHELGTIHPVELRQNLGIMPQDPYLFAATLGQNIALESPLSKERILELIQLTGLEPLVRQNGMGEAFAVDENGRNLSAGQRRMVALARALANDAPILILDEPTTGMDVSLEQQVIGHLKPIVADKTLLLITHRHAALALCDRVVVIAGGKIVLDGPRESVLAKLSGKSEAAGA
jgi:ATP-binding cassette subfamily B protein/ATP-binding cassette subfamily C protein LapB